jgi:hypothetical protein
MPSAPASETPEIETAEQYSEAVAEVQRLHKARSGSPEFERRQALEAPLYEYEQRHLRPEYRPGRPRRSAGP